MERGNNLHATELLPQVYHPRCNESPSQPIVDGQFLILAEEALEDRPDTLLAIRLYLGVDLGGGYLGHGIGVVLLGRAAVNEVTIPESLKLLKTVS